MEGTGSNSRVNAASTPGKSLIASAHWQNPPWQRQRRPRLRLPPCPPARTRFLTRHERLSNAGLGYFWHNCKNWETIRSKQSMSQRSHCGHTESPARRRPSDGNDAKKVPRRRFLAFVWLSLPCDMLIRGPHQNKELTS